MKFKHAEWRRLYREEQGAFAQLPWFARAAAAELLKPCDDAGRIHVGDGRDDTEALIAAVGFRMGATTGDRRMMRALFPLLFAEGYLVRRGAHVVVRNFVAAQRRWDEPESDANPTRTERESDANRERVGREPDANRERTVSEPSPKTELSARNHDGDDASARARARSSVLCREEKTETHVELEPAATPERSGPDAVPLAAVREVFAHWQATMGSRRSALDAKRERVIRVAIDRYGVADCRLAVDGCFDSDFHMNRSGGGNDRGHRFNTVEFIFRDADHTEKFRDAARDAQERRGAEAAEKALQVAAHEAGAAKPRAPHPMLLTLLAAEKAHA